MNGEHLNWAAGRLGHRSGVGAQRRRLGRVSVPSSRSPCGLGVSGMLGAASSSTVCCDDRRLGAGGSAVPQTTLAADTRQALLSKLQVIL